MSTIDELLRDAERHAASAPGSSRPRQPSRRVTVLTCMDTRLNPYDLLGLEPGDAHILRNAGGVATDDALRSLSLSQRLLGTREVMVVQHTDCGLDGLDAEAFARDLERETGVRPPWPIEAFDDIDESVRRSLARIRSSPFVPHSDAVRGFVYDVAAGRLREVV